MKVLLAIAHVFSPKEGSLYSSENEEKRTLKSKALESSTVGNLIRHQRRCWIHASLGLGKSVVTRQLTSAMGVELFIELYTPRDATLNRCNQFENLKIVEPESKDFRDIPGEASRSVLERAAEYDMVGYMEDDLVINDQEFFHKVRWLVDQCGEEYGFMPHRCELIPSKGEVILSGDPDGGRPDLFWATGESLKVQWPLGEKYFYRATNPHSGCFFLTRAQAMKVRSYWASRAWKADFQLAGPLEQASSGILLPVLKIMKPVPADYRFLMVHHYDELWRRHEFER